MEVAEAAEAAEAALTSRGADKASKKTYWQWLVELPKEHHAARSVGAGELAVGEELTRTDTGETGHADSKAERN